MLIIKKNQSRKPAIPSLPLALLSCLTHLCQAYEALHGHPRGKFAIARLPSSCGQQRWIFFSAQCFLALELGSEVFFDLILRTYGRCITWKCQPFFLLPPLFFFFSPCFLGQSGKPSFDQVGKFRLYNSPTTFSSWTEGPSWRVRLKTWD